MSFKDDFTEEVPALVALGGGLLTGGIEYLCYKHTIINLPALLALASITGVIMILLMKR